MTQPNAFRTNVAEKPSSNRGKADGFWPFTRFFLHGVQICKRTFSFVHIVGKERLQNLCKAVDSNGVVQRIHGNAKQPQHNQTKEAEAIRVRDFITNVGTRPPNAPTRLCCCLQICQTAKSTEITQPFVSKVALLQLDGVRSTNFGVQSFQQ